MLIFISGWGRGMGLNRAKNLIKLTEGEVHLIYPDDKWVSEEKIMGWAEDAFADGDIDHKPENLEDAIEMLNDAGIITTHKAWWKKSHHEDLWPASKPGFSPGISATTQLIPEQGVKDWRIQSKMGTVFGEFKGVTPTGALNAWAKTRGYQSFDAMKKDGLAKSFEVMQGFRIIVEAKDHK